MARLLRGEMIDDMETVRLSKDGTRLTLSVALAPIRDAAGAIVGASAIARDITERKRTEDALRLSEHHFRTLVEQSLDLVAILEANGTYRYASPSHTLASGFTPEELVGRNGFDLVHPEDVAATRKTFATAVERGRTTGVAEYRFRHKNGSWRIIEAVFKNLLDDPAVNGILVHGVDVTDRRGAEEALLREKAFAESLIDTANVIVLGLDSDGRVQIFNSAAERITGYTRAELMERGWDVVVPRDRYPAVWDHFQQLLREGGRRPWRIPSSPSAARSAS